MNQEDLMFEYLLQMGAMRPEEIEMMRKQKQIDALREGASEQLQGQMIGKHYVAPSWTQGLAQLGKGYMAGQAQKQQDVAMRGMTDRQRQMLEDLRRRRQNPSAMGPSAMYQDRVLSYGDGMNY